MATDRHACIVPTRHFKSAQALNKANAIWDFLQPARDPMLVQQHVGWIGMPVSRVQVVQVEPDLRGDDAEAPGRAAVERQPEVVHLLHVATVGVARRQPGGLRLFYGCSYVHHLSGNDRRDSHFVGS